MPYSFPYQYTKGKQFVNISHIFAYFHVFLSLYII